MNEFGSTWFKRRTRANNELQPLTAEQERKIGTRAFIVWHALCSISVRRRWRYVTNGRLEMAANSLIANEFGRRSHLLFNRRALLRALNRLEEVGLIEQAFDTRTVDRNGEVVRRRFKRYKVSYSFPFAPIESITAIMALPGRGGKRVTGQTVPITKAPEQVSNCPNSDLLSSPSSSSSFSYEKDRSRSVASSVFHTKGSEGDGVPSNLEVEGKTGTVLRGTGSLNYTDPLPFDFIAALPDSDSVEKTSTSHQVIYPTTPQPARVRAMLAAYNSAVRETYGDTVKTHPWGNPIRMKAYPSLVKAAAALVEEEIPPLSWALWWLPKLRRRFPDSPPPVGLLFAESSIQKRAGWFRNEFKEGGISYVPTRQHLEQMFRRREAELRCRGAGDEDVFFRGFPEWYADMRVEEIKSGFADPIMCFPRLTKQGR